MQSGKIVIATSSFQTQSLVLFKMIKEIKNEKKIKIGNKVLGEKQPLFITAEIGITCNYDMNITKELIDVTKEAGADAIKLIFWFPEEIMSDKTISYSYETTKGKVSENMFEMLNKLRFTLDEWYEIKEYADKQGIIIFSTVNSPSGIEYAEAIDLDAYKLSSWDYNYFPLWKQISKLNKPMIIDTGPVNTLEVAKVMQLMKDAENNQSILVHCFHTDDHGEMNMRAIPYMRDAFDTLVGYSSRDQDSETDIMAVTMGAVYLEKRLTLDQNLPGHHHNISMEPNDFMNYVTLIRNVQTAIGLKDLKPSKPDLIERKKWFRHLVANKDIKAGTIISKNMLEGKRPENGISPEYQKLFIGKKLKCDLKYNETITWDDV
jgi:sialic acid synthase SpsE